MTIRPCLNEGLEFMKADTKDAVIMDVDIYDDGTLGVCVGQRHEDDYGRYDFISSEYFLDLEEAEGLYEWLGKCIERLKEAKSND